MSVILRREKPSFNSNWFDYSFPSVIHDFTNVFGFNSNWFDYSHYRLRFGRGRCGFNSNWFDYSGAIRVMTSSSVKFQFQLVRLQ